MTRDSREDLKPLPCPFCGTVPTPHYPTDLVRCNECNYPSPGFWAMEHWNRRAPQPQPGNEERGEKAKRIAERIHEMSPCVPSGECIKHRDKIAALILSEFADAPAGDARTKAGPYCRDCGHWYHHGKCREPGHAADGTCLCVYVTPPPGHHGSDNPHIDGCTCGRCGTFETLLAERNALEAEIAKLRETPRPQRTDSGQREINDAIEEFLRCHSCDHQRHEGECRAERESRPCGCLDQVGDGRELERMAESLIYWRRRAETPAPKSRSDGALLREAADVIFADQDAEIEKLNAALSASRAEERRLRELLGRCATAMLHLKQKNHVFLVACSGCSNAESAMAEAELEGGKR